MQEEDADLIVCPTTKWYLQRRLLMAGMFLAMSGWFFYDWAVKYPRERDEYDVWHPKFKELVLDNRGDSSKTAKLEEGRLKYAELAKQNGWPENPKDDHVDHDARIAGQLRWAIGSAAVGAGVLGFFFANRGRPLRADREALLTPWGKRVPFSSVTLVDKRKWETKWLAYARYKGTDGKPAKAVIDGFIYQNAQKVLDRLLANFTGDVLELVKDEEKPSAKAAGEPEAAPAPAAASVSTGETPPEDKSN